MMEKSDLVNRVYECQTEEHGDVGKQLIQCIKDLGIHLRYMENVYTTKIICIFKIHKTFII